ncbi:MAG: GTPase ObgE [Elusimicrobia bacterium]|nr:GTPase ObgE [Elusimicrobiota bacterium]
MNFVDKVKVFAKGGKGGDGALSFRREKYVEFGGPDGGMGGKGGDIHLVADATLGTLLDFSRRPRLLAGDGRNGKGANKTGEGAEDMVIKVPIGTVVYKNDRLLADLAKPGDRVLVARGGRGGRGNLSFKTRQNTAPRIAEKGEPGEAAELELELKLIADVGLAGFPNAGKSTLLSRMTMARPKIAEYPFTTLAPHLGVVEHKRYSFVMADIPGLIEGAHAGKGLGDAFLRHVERTRMLVHLVDPMGFGGRDALDGIRVIEGELKAFSSRLAAKPRVLVVNKLDLPEGPVVLEAVRRRYRARRVFGISCATGQGIPELSDFLVTEVQTLPRESGPVVPGPDRESLEVKPGFLIERVSGGFRVRGPYVERIATMADMTLPEAVARFQFALKKIGVDRALKKAGIREGDAVRIGDVEFEWTDAPFARLPRLPRTRRVRLL